MKIITLNVNGIRSAHKKGLFDWLAKQNADVICLQEIKAHQADIPNELINWNGYYSYFHPAVKKGYSGVAIYSKDKPIDIKIGIDNTGIDIEGRYIEVSYPNNFKVASIYLPSGSSGELRQAKKFEFLEYYTEILKRQIATNDKYIICGDLNIAHQEIDLKNWKNNRNNSGFLPEERHWFSSMLNLGFADAWRTLYPSLPGYTWWSNRGQAYTNNVGWRIDYHIISQNMLTHLKHASVYKETKFSDHAPLIIDYQL